MATLVTYTVTPGGADSGTDWSTLSGAVTAVISDYPNFVTSDVYVEIVISGDWTSSPDTTVVTGSTITTDATRYLHIYTSGDAVHNGIYGGKASSYRLEISADHGIQLSEIENLRISGLQIQVTSTVNFGNDHGIHLVFNSAGTADVRIYNNIIKGVMSGSSQRNEGIYIYSGNSDTKTIRIWNNIIYDFVNSTNVLTGIWATGTASSGVVLTAYNNTFQNCYDGIEQTQGTVSSYNNGFSGMTNASYVGTVGGQTGDSSSTPSFANEGGDDFHLSSADGTWLGQTSDQSSGLFSDDIDFVTRPASWSVGADDYIPGTTHVMTGRYMLIARSDGTTG